MISSYVPTKGTPPKPYRTIERRCRPTTIIQAHLNMFKKEQVKDSLEGSVI